MVLPFSFGIVLLVRSMVCYIIVASQAHEFRWIRIRGAEIHGWQIVPLLCRARWYQRRRDRCETGATLHEGFKVKWYTAGRSSNRHTSNVQWWLHKGWCFHRFKSKRIRSLLGFGKHRQGVQSVVIIQPDRQWIRSVRSRCCSHCCVVLDGFGGKVILSRKLRLYHGFHI